MERKLKYSQEELVGSFGPSSTFSEPTDERVRGERDAARLPLEWEPRQSILRSTMLERVLQCDQRFCDSEAVRINYSIAAVLQFLFEPHELFRHSAANGPGAAVRTGGRP